MINKFYLYILSNDIKNPYFNVIVYLTFIILLNYFTSNVTHCDTVENADHLIKEVLGQGNSVIMDNNISTITLENGWTISVDSQGTKTIKHSDGFQEIRYATGAEVTTYPNGDKVYSFPDENGEQSITIRTEPVECDIYGNLIDGNATAEIITVPLTENQIYLEKLMLMSLEEQVTEINLHLYDRISDMITNSSEEQVNVKVIVRDCLRDDITRNFWLLQPGDSIGQDDFSGAIVQENYNLINSNQSPLSFTEKRILAHINVQLVINNSAVVHNRSLDDLLNNDNLYKHLYEKQFKQL